MTIEITRPPALSPVSSLTAEEITRVSALLHQAGHVTDAVRFVYVGLLEPAKSEVLAARAGGAIPDRQARVLLLDTSTGTSLDATVNLTSGTVSTVEIDTTKGQLPILDDEFASVDPILRASEEWAAALAKRGLKIDEVVTAPLSPGYFKNDGEEGLRVLRVIAFQFSDPTDHPWAHPIDGLSVYVDVISKTVLRVLDEELLPIPAEPSKFHLPEGRPAPLEGLKPIEITQPEGPSFTVEGDRVSWANWTLDIGFDAREGLVLHNLAFADPDHGGEVRPVVYRASIAEMLVAYADPAPTRYWQNYFDTGEYLFGRYTNSLTLGCDCLGEIRYFDAVLADEFGNPRTIRNAICMHEEDYGTLWKHTDVYVEGVSEVRRQRRLVISFFTTVGNYDYGFYWYLYLDGKIELEAKLTGIAIASSYKGIEDWPYATEVAPGVGAPFHQHLFSARLDMMVDGLANAVDEVEAAPLPISEQNPYGNAFTFAKRRIASEDEGGRRADSALGRTWHIVNTERTNRYGQPTGYVLEAQQGPTLLADPDSSVHARGTFATKELWVTAYDPAERYPAGDLVNQNPGGDGLPAYMAANRNLDGADLVVWHTFGLTHFPRPEDWPVMPVDYAGFRLLPYGFFDRNPALNVPANKPAHGGTCCASNGS
ncbi:primary-amine oxidase [Streptomyces plumbiresistens]|uniref:Amine oxidase n=1 Tax=Streptomyces plumbiresistens TaxID=511811 RepID=A0ABP7SM44_9ACTN